MCILKAGGTYMSEKIKNAETALHNKVKSLYKGGNVTYAEQVCDFWITTIKNDAHMDILSFLLREKYAGYQTRQNFGHNSLAELPLLVIDQLKWNKGKLSKTSDVNPNILMKNLLNILDDNESNEKNKCGKKTSNDSMPKRRRKEFLERDMKSTFPVFSENITVASIGKHTILRYPFSDAEYYSFYFFKAFNDFLPDIGSPKSISVQRICNRLSYIANKIMDNNQCLTSLHEANSNEYMNPAICAIGQLQFLQRLDADFYDNPVAHSLQILPELFIISSPDNSSKYFENDRDYAYLRTINNRFNVTAQYRKFFLSKHFFFTMLYMWDFSDDLAECVIPMLMSKMQIDELLACAYEVYQAEFQHHMEFLAGQRFSSAKNQDPVDYYLNNHMLSNFTKSLLNYVDNWILEPIKYMSQKYRKEVSDNTATHQQIPSPTSFTVDTRKKDKQYLAKIAEDTDIRLNKVTGRLCKLVDYASVAYHLATFQYLISVIKGKRITK